MTVGVQKHFRLFLPMSPRRWFSSLVPLNIRPCGRVVLDRNGQEGDIMAKSLTLEVENVFLMFIL